MKIFFELLNASGEFSFTKITLEEFKERCWYIDSENIDYTEDNLNFDYGDLPVYSDKSIVKPYNDTVLSNIVYITEVGEYYSYNEIPEHLRKDYIDGRYIMRFEKGKLVNKVFDANIW